MYTILIKIFIMALITAPLLHYSIPLLRILKFGQHIRVDGPQEHLKKAGTPTMGGLVFIPIALIATLICTDIKVTGSICFLVFAFAVIGFLDDYLKISKKENEGLKEKQKLFLQILVSIIFLLIINDGATHTYIPFFKGSIDIGYLYFPFLLVVILGTVNGVNLTDGLDGLSSSVTIFALVYFTLIGVHKQSDIASISAIFIGVLIAFLAFNFVPAKIFMGDTGSLALGGLISGLAIYLKIPVIIIFVGIMYFVNALSVIIQVSYYKKTKKRIFKMAPFHHHLELSGWSEKKVVFVFSFLTIIFGALAYYGYLFYIY